VTKVLPPWGDSAVAPGAAEASIVEEQLHSAKAVERLDLGFADGRGRVDRLISEASAVIVAGPMDFRRAFALAPSDIWAVREGVVYCGLTGFGSSGPLANAPATEFDAQLIGAMTRQVGEAGSAPVRQGFHLVSVNTGYAAAQAVMAGLLAADATERTDPDHHGGRHFEVSLLRTAVALNGWNLTAESGHDGVAGKQVEATGWPPDHGYTCKDRQALISMRNNDEGWVKLLAALDRHPPDATRRRAGVDSTSESGE
jgi:crotonobetainyl-CoA:carnitine CoA-transferase CaiB-like acyl-CoA transferase